MTSLTQTTTQTVHSPHTDQQPPAVSVPSAAVDLRQDEGERLAGGRTEEKLRTTSTFSRVFTVMQQLTAEQQRHNNHDLNIQ